jgi:hypothetical protein
MVYCNRHGDVYEDNCWCDWGWYDTNCTISGIDKWGTSSWYTFRVIFTVLYVLLLLISLIKLNYTLSQDKVIGFKRLIDRLFRSPRNLCFLYLVIIGTLRISWLLTDPLRFNNNFSRLAERILYETVYPSIYGLYSSVLLVWGGLYQGMRSKRSDPFKILRKMLMGMMILAFPISITISILKGFRVSPTIWNPLGISFVVAGVVLLLVGFAIFAVLLTVYAEKNTIDVNLNGIKPGYIIKSNYKRLKKNKTLNIWPSEIKADTLDSSRYDLRQNDQSWDEIETIKSIEENITERLNFEKGSTIKRKRESTGPIISLITKDDRIILRKLVILLTLSIILGVVILIFFSMLSSSLSSASPNEQFFILYCVFFTEIFACLLIYIVFTTQIKVKDKNLLRYFTMLSMKMIKKKPSIRYSNFFSTIGPRLHNFYS